MTEQQETLWKQYQPLVHSTLKELKRKLRESGLPCDDDDLESDAQFKLFLAIDKLDLKRSWIEAYLQKAMENFTKTKLRDAVHSRKTSRLSSKLYDKGSDPEEFIRNIECPKELLKYVKRILYSDGKIRDIIKSNKLSKWYSEVKPKLRKWLLDVYGELNE